MIFLLLLHILLPVQNEIVLSGSARIIARLLNIIGALVVFCNEGVRYFPGIDMESLLQRWEQDVYCICWF